MKRNKSYSNHQLKYPLHSMATSTTISSSSVGYYEEIILPEGQNTYDVLDWSQQGLNTRQVKPANPIPVRVAAGEKEH